MSTTYHPQIDVTPVEKTVEEIKKPIEEPEKKSAWKLHLLTAITLISLVLFNFCPPIRSAFFDFGVVIQSMGWTGPFFLMLLNGLVVIPLALPYPVFELTIALLVPNYFAAVWFSLAAKTIGAAVSFIVTKYMRETIRGYLSSVHVFKGIEYSMEKDPVKFSLIIRVMILPIFVKNYGLAIPKSVNFKLYMICDLITNIPITIAYIYLLRQAGNLAGLFSPDQSWEQMTFTLSMITLSIGLFIYIAVITKEVLKEMQEMEKQTEKVEKGDKGDTTSVEKNIELEVKSDVVTHIPATLRITDDKIILEIQRDHHKTFEQSRG